MNKVLKSEKDFERFIQDLKEEIGGRLGTNPDELTIELAPPERYPAVVCKSHQLIARYGEVTSFTNPYPFYGYIYPEELEEIQDEMRQRTLFSMVGRFLMGDKTA